jgi:hypothetical protein
MSLFFARITATLIVKKDIGNKRRLLVKRMYE